MIEKKCKICGEWVNAKKIAMHYWNEHHVKYAEYKQDEESRDTEATATKIEVPQKEIVGEKTNEKKANKETITNNTISTTATATTTEIEAPAPVFETETVDNGVVEQKKPEPEIPEANMWKETAHLFDSYVQNETRNEYKSVQTPTRDSETMNEWCN